MAPINVVSVQPMGRGAETAAAEITLQFAVPKNQSNVLINKILTWTTPLLLEMMMNSS